MVTRATWDQVAAIGPYFAVTCGERPDAAGFRPLAELYAEPAALDGYVRAVARRLGTDQLRVAASTLHLGTASRLWSIALASTALSGGVPDLSPDRLWWRPAASGPVELWLPAQRDLPQDPVAALHDTVAVQNLPPLGEAVRRGFGVSPRALHGNAASALVGALRVLLTRAPHAPHPVMPLVRELLAREPLTGAGSFDTDENRTITFRRRSCCLYYRVSGSGTCGDCVLNPRERTG